MKKTFLICLFIIFTLSVAVLSAAADSIKVAINPDSKPFKYYDENGAFSGIDADVM